MPDLHARETKIGLKNRTHCLFCKLGILGKTERFIHSSYVRVYPFIPCLESYLNSTSATLLLSRRLVSAYLTLQFIGRSVENCRAQFFWPTVCAEYFLSSSQEPITHWAPVLVYFIQFFFLSNILRIGLS